MGAGGRLGPLKTKVSRFSGIALNTVVKIRGTQRKEK